MVADELGLDLLQIDLSEVVDKYIGETEKNLEKVFEQAESLNVVLFFDEADALFGQRSDVKDAHDRYANQEVALPAPAARAVPGLTVLATNLRGNLDQAFTRRLDLVVDLPRPGRRDPSAAVGAVPRPHVGHGPSDPPDVALLADTLELAGGAIRNIVLTGVYDATAEASLLGMRHVVQAALREYQKMGRRPPTGVVSGSPG